MDTSAARAASETAAGNRHPATGERFPETDDAFPAAGIRLPDPGPLPETDGPGRRMVSIAADDLLALLLASDLVAEHRKAIISATPAIVGLDTLDVLSEAGLIDPDTLDVTDAFTAAMARAAKALGISGGVRPARPPINDNFEDDVSAAEAGFAPDSGCRLPVAGSFSHD